jgi:NAD-dependent dihydropyrimidine dehydrogenase PreA subunit
MQNYAPELLAADGRLEYAGRFLNGFAARTPVSLERLEWLARTRLLGLARPWLTWAQKRDHFGQVVPLEDVEAILAQLPAVIRLPCVCRRATTGQAEARYCFGLLADDRLAEVVDDSFCLEVLSPGEALALVRGFDREGLVHSVWTFRTPYIGGLCNCDQDCVAYQVCHVHRYFQVMFRGETVAEVEWGACNGCKACVRQCQYGALRYSAANKKVSVDPRQCYGCGVCRAACARHAIHLHDRAADPVAAGHW